MKIYFDMEDVFNDNGNSINIESELDLSSFDDGLDEFRVSYIEDYIRPFRDKRKEESVVWDISKCNDTIRYTPKTIPGVYVRQIRNFLNWFKSNQFHGKYNKDENFFEFNNNHFSIHIKRILFNDQCKPKVCIDYSIYDKYGYINSFNKISQLNEIEEIIEKNVRGTIKPILSLVEKMGYSLSYTNGFDLAYFKNNLKSGLPKLRIHITYPEKYRHLKIEGSWVDSKHRTKQIFVVDSINDLKYSLSRTNLLFKWILDNVVDKYLAPCTTQFIEPTYDKFTSNCIGSPGSPIRRMYEEVLFNLDCLGYEFIYLANCRGLLLRKNENRFIILHHINRQGDGELYAGVKIYTPREEYICPHFDKNRVSILSNKFLDLIYEFDQKII